MDLPDNAEKKFSGIIFDVYHYEQELYDGTKATFEKLKRATTLQTLGIVGDKIIIVKDSQPHRETMWSLPGGRIEEREDDLTGAQREFMEETGFESQTWTPLRTYSPYNKIDWEIKIFLARDCKKTTEPEPDAGEKIELHLVDFDEFIDIVCADKFHDHQFANEVLRMRVNGKLDILKKEIFA